MAARKYWWAALGAALLYAGLWFGYAHNWSALASFDDAILGFFHDFGAHRPAWLGFWHDLSSIYTTKVLSGVAGLVALVALGYKQFRVAAFLFLTVGMMGLLTAGAKTLAHRPRPSTMLDFEGSTSFPSGHAVGITVAVFAVATVLWPGLSPRWRRAVAAVGATLIVLILSARVILNVHHPSDVAAGFALGFLWYLLWVSVIPPWPPTRPRRAEAPENEAVSVPSTGR